MRYIYTALFSIITLSAFSQSDGYIIKYRHCFQPDLFKSLTDTIGKEAILTGNNSASCYRLNKLVTQVSGKVAPVTASTTKMNTSISYDSTGDMVFFDKANDSVFVREKMISSYVLTAEKKPQIQWQLLTEEKTIQGYLCKKASCCFRGRCYTAWYTMDIPIADGPWKFKGLPGLIIDLQDDKQQVRIYASNITFPTIATVAPFQPLGEKITLQSYYTFYDRQFAKGYELHAAAIQNPHSFMPNQIQNNRPHWFRIELQD
jgi:GLPGLI family protein